MAFLGKKLRLLRTEHKLSEAEMSRIIGISRPTYRKIEEDLRELELTEIDKLSTKFGLPNDYFSSKEDKKLTSVLKVEETVVPYHIYKEHIDDKNEIIRLLKEKLSTMEPEKK